MLIKILLAAAVYLLTAYASKKHDYYHNRKEG